MSDQVIRTAIVTGASRGIGRAIAVALGELGFQVAINYHSNSAAAREAAEAVTGAGGVALVVQADIASAEDRRRLVEQTVGHFGPIHLLVNNAGVAPRVRSDMLETSDDKEFDYVLSTNLKGPYMLSVLVANHMLVAKPQSAAIVNIGSISAYTASINRGEYCIAKAGLAMMTRLFATRLAPHGINVYEVRPGIIDTDMTAGVKQKYDKLIHEEHLTPIRRWGQPRDVALAVAAIAEGRLPFSTGQIINVDGGFHLRTL
jgi:3-oxoacyl-[acyl-carrier protein] reductase